jgi:hypothetical protein
MSTPPLEIVDKRGDVYLDICRIKGENILKSILVSSHVLVLCSGYFQRCFEGKFSESEKFQNNIKNGQKTHITLNEDDPEIILILCRALHHQAQDTPNIKALKSLWKHGDKYDCIISLRPLYRGWVREHMDALISPSWWGIPTRRSEIKNAKDLLHLLKFAYPEPEPDKWVQNCDESESESYSDSEARCYSDSESEIDNWGRSITKK